VISLLFVFRPIVADSRHDSERSNAEYQYVLYFSIIAQENL